MMLCSTRCACDSRPSRAGPFKDYAFAPKDGTFEMVAKPAPVASLDELAEDVFEVVGADNSEC